MMHTRFILTTILFWFILVCCDGQFGAESFALTSLPNSPINTSSGVRGSLQCTKNSDESYAVCASWNANTAIKYNLQPFSFAAKGPNQGYYMSSCDLFETSSQSTSRAVCVDRYSGTKAVYFHRVSDMINITNVTIGVASNYPRVIVDTPNQVAYISNYNNAPAIYKITNIGSSTPIVAATLTSFGSGDNSPSAMLIIDGFLYVHFYMSPSRLARINISTFTWNQTVNFTSGEYGGYHDNLANDDNYIYDLTQNGILVRCTYKNNFTRFDSLSTGFSNTHSLAISPDSSFLLLTAYYSGILVVNTSTFSVESRALLPNPSSSGYVQAFGRPIILSKNNNTNAYPVCAFSSDNDYLYTFNFSRVSFREEHPTIYPLPSTPISTSSGVTGSLQCTKNSDESYAVCASWNTNTAIKYNLQPFSFAAKGPNQGYYMYSCDLYESSSQSTSRAVCAKGYSGTNGIVYFHRVSDMINITKVTIGGTGSYVHVIVDTPNQVAFVSNFNNPRAIYQITNIGSSTPLFAATLTSFGSGDNSPSAMLIIDGFLYVHFYMTPARLARINIFTFIWNQTVTFANGESYGYYDNLANDDNFIYDLTQYGIIVRCTYKNNFTRFDSLSTGFSNTHSLAISPDQRTLFVMSTQNSVLQMVNTSSFAMFGNVATVPSAWGRPIITSWCNVYAFSSNSALVYAFRLSSSLCGTLSATVSPDMSQTNSASTQRSMSLTVSAQISASISTSTSTSPSTSFPSASSSFSSASISNSNSETISAQITESAKTTSASDTPSNSIDETSSKLSRSNSRDISTSLSQSTTKEITNTSSSSLTYSLPELLLTESKVVPRVDPVPALPGLTDALSSTGAIAAFSGVGAVAAQQNRLTAVASLVRCGEGEGITDVKPGYISSPLQLRIGNDLFGWNRGLLIGNILVLISFTAFVLVIAFAYSRKVGKFDLQTALLHLRFPGIVMLPALVLMPPSAEKAVALFWFSKGSGGRDLFLAIFCGSVLVFAPCVITLLVCDFSARGRLTMHKENVEQGAWIGKKHPKFAESSIYKLYIYLTEIQFEFTDGKRKSDDIVNLSALLNENNNNSNDNKSNQHHHMSIRGSEGATEFLAQNPWFARVGTMVESYSLFYFAFADVTVSAVLGFMAGTAAEAASFTHCMTIFCINIVCCFTHLFLLLRYRGVTPRYLLVYMTSASAITLVAVILALFQYVGRLLHADSAWEYLRLAQTMLGFFVAILSIIGFVNSLFQLVDFYFVGIFNRGNKNDEEQKSKNFGASREMLNQLDDNFVIDIEEELRNLPSSPPPPIVIAVTQQEQQQPQQELEPIDLATLLADLDELGTESGKENVDLGILFGNSTSTNGASHTVDVLVLPEMTQEPIRENNNNNNNQQENNNNDSIQQGNNNNNDNNEPNLLALLDEIDREEKEKEEIKTVTRRLVSASRGNREMMRNQNELQRMFGCF